MNKAIFLDRDGVVIEENGSYNYKPDHIIFNEGIVEALTEFQRKGYKILIITNQGGIAKGIYDTKDVKSIHKNILAFFNQYHVKVTDILFCPHHDAIGKCLCRKPDSLLLEKAMARFDIKALDSYFIGDQDRDIEAGEKAGLQTIKINPNENLAHYMHLIK